MQNLIEFLLSNTGSILKSNTKTIITSKGSSISNALTELWRSPALIRAFASRDLYVRYAQTYLGFAWSIIQPLFGLATLFVLFNKIAGIPTGGIPFLAFALSGLIFWNYFNYVLSQSAGAIVAMQAMVKKIYLPRLSIPTAKALVGLVDYSVGLALLIGTCLYYDISLKGLLFLPIILAGTAMGALGIGLTISAISLRYRDLQQIIPFALQLLFFLTPVAYPTSMLVSLLGKQWQWLVYLNPLAGMLELFRGFLFDTDFSTMAWLSLIITPVLLFIGLLSFVKADKKMADIV